MKAKINGIEFEGTPEEFAKFIGLQVPKAEHQPKHDESRPHVRKKYAGCTEVNVTYQGKPVGTMNFSELSTLLGVNKKTVINWFRDKSSYNYGEYSATIIKRGVIKNGIRVKATDTNGNNRIFPSTSLFCTKTNTSYEAFRWLRYRQPEGPWKINGYIVERIN